MYSIRDIHRNSVRPGLWQWVLRLSPHIVTLLRWITRGEVEKAKEKNITSDMQAKRKKEEFPNQ